MKGKIGIVVGLAAGYVLGARAGHERYEQIKDRFLEVWNTPPVQKQVEKVAELSKTAAKAVPSVLWDGAVKVTKAATSKSGTPGEKFEAAVTESKKVAAEAADAAKAAEADPTKTNGASKTNGAAKTPNGKTGSAGTSADAAKDADA